MAITVEGNTGMTDLLLKSSAVFSEPDESGRVLFRYRLDRDVQDDGLVFVYFGVNGSTAGAEVEDQTTKKWRVFTRQNGGRKYIAVNPFGFRATDVKELATARDPIGPENDRHIADAISEADILVPCWGNRQKIPPRLRHHFDRLRRMIFNAGKPVRVFGFTASGDPKHPLMLGYDTPLIPWSRAES